MSTAVSFASELPAIQLLRERAARLQGRLAELHARHQSVTAKFEALQGKLALADPVRAELERLSQQLFQSIIHVMETKITMALHEVIEQPLQLRVKPQFKRGSIALDLTIERMGEEEDILRGQGGSVANVLSVGFRLFALTQSDPRRHRPFVVLDEPDCWIRPDLVPKLVNIIASASRSLGLQVILVSHHDVTQFAHLVDRVYRIQPQQDGSVVVEQAFGEESGERIPMEAVVMPSELPQPVNELGKPATPGPAARVETALKASRLGDTSAGSMQSSLFGDDLADDATRRETV